MATDREILLKLKRQYSKDETVSMLANNLKEVETECGILRSERDELADNNKKNLALINSLQIELKKHTSGVKINERVKQEKNRATRQQRKAKDYQAKYIEFRDKFLSLLAKNRLTHQTDNH